MWRETSGWPTILSDPALFSVVYIALKGAPQAQCARNVRAQCARSARAVQLFGRLAVLETHTLRY